MEICCSHNMSVSEDLSSFCELSLGSPEIPNDNNKNLDINDLANCMTEFLNIQNKQKSTCDVIPSWNNGQIVTAAKEVECKDKDSNEIELDKLANEKCLSKCATFPCSGKSECSDDIFDMEEMQKRDLPAEDSATNGHDQPASCPYPRSKSLPTPLTLVPAMKGSREKQGISPRKLTVSWAPDVYDPLPTAVSHVPNSKPHRYRYDNKRNGNNKQKGGGKASRGSRGKEKKQSRKSGGSSIKSFKSVDNDGNGACSSGPRASTLDFNVGSPDQFCGHTFLKKSVTPLPFPVTEAT